MVTDVNAHGAHVRKPAFTGLMRCIGAESGKLLDEAGEKVLDIDVWDYVGRANTFKKAYHKALALQGLVIVCRCDALEWDHAKETLQPKARANASAASRLNLALSAGAR